jgi:hypothetical protein
MPNAQHLEDITYDVADRWTMLWILNIWIEHLAESKGGLPEISQPSPNDPKVKELFSLLPRSVFDIPIRRDGVDGTEKPK